MRVYVYAPATHGLRAATYVYCRYEQVGSVITPLRHSADKLYRFEHSTNEVDSTVWKSWANKNPKPVEGKTHVLINQSINESDLAELL